MHRLRSSTPDYPALSKAVKSLAANTMRHLLFILAIIPFSLNCVGQEQRINSFTKDLHNSQLTIDRFNNWRSAIKGPAADSLIKIGKPATPHLLAALSDSTKGTIAHFLLTYIWNNELRAEERVYVDQHLDTTVKARYQISNNGFPFYLDDNDHPYTKRKTLAEIKEFWMTFLNRQSSR